MNPRIKELAVEAKLPGYVLEYGTELCIAPHLEKFAELLLKECESLFPHQFTDEKYPRRIDKTIRKHFGGEQ